MCVRWSKHWWFEILIGLFVKIEVHEHGGQGDRLLVPQILNSSALFAGCEDILKGLLSSICATQTVLDNEKETKDLKEKVKAILSIVKQYQKHDSLHALGNRLEIFCKSVAFHGFFCNVYIHQMFCSAITTQLKPIEDMQKHPLLAREAKGTKDADKILKAIRNIDSLCGVFKVGFRVINKVSRGCWAVLQMDTQLNIEEKVGDILQVRYFHYFQAQEWG